MRKQAIPTKEGGHLYVRRKLLRGGHARRGNPSGDKKSQEKKKKDPSPSWYPKAEKRQGRRADYSYRGGTKGSAHERVREKYTCTSWDRPGLVGSYKGYVIKNHCLRTVAPNNRFEKTLRHHFAGGEVVERGEQALCRKIDSTEVVGERFSI